MAHKHKQQSGCLGRNRREGQGIDGRVAIDVRLERRIDLSRIDRLQQMPGTLIKCLVYVELANRVAHNRGLDMGDRLGSHQPIGKCR